MRLWFILLIFGLSACKNSPETSDSSVDSGDAGDSDNASDSDVSHPDGSDGDVGQDTDEPEPSWRATGLIHWWKLDGNGIDERGNTDGQFFGSPETNADCPSEQCLSFDGSEDFVVVQDPHFIPSESEDYSIAGWFLMDQDKDQGLFGYSGETDTSEPLSMFVRGVYEPNRLFWVVRGDNTTGGVRLDVGAHFETGRWYHLVGVKQNDSYTVFVNGSQNMTVNQAIEDDVLERNLFVIGTMNDGEPGGADDHFLDGAIDEVMVWDRALTESEVSDLFLYFDYSPPEDPSCYDGVQNQGEDDIDCGGPCISCTVDGEPKAFPEAEGAGRVSRGAYAGSETPAILTVTSLDSGTEGNDTTGEGTLAWALTRNYPRIVLFGVSGTIDMTDYGNIEIVISQPYITIAGESAPSPGVTIRGVGLHFQNTHEVIIRHVRIRPGDENVPAELRQGPDGISFGATPGNSSYNFIADHCSISWAIDEGMGLYNHGEGTRNLTVSHCIIAETLDYSIHEKSQDDFPGGPINHAMGILSANAVDVSLIKNVLAHHHSRGPLFAGDRLLVGNILIYNMEIQRVYFSGTSRIYEAAVIGNVHRPGLDTLTDALVRIPNAHADTRIYFEDNHCPGMDPDDVWSIIDADSVPESVIAGSNPLGELFTPISGSELEAYLDRYSGARPADRDPVDERILSEIETGEGRLRGCADDQPQYRPTRQARAATSNTITLALAEPDGAEGNRRLNRREIEIVSGTGSGQIRLITDYRGENRIATVESDWDVVPDSSSEYRIDNCTQNGGGWPELAENVRHPTEVAGYPSDDPHGDDDEDGYSNLEEWLHAQARLVEGR